ncbi:MAG: hypothetical protein ACTTGU_08310 [Moraxella sp.]
MGKYAVGRADFDKFYLLTVILPIPPFLKEVEESIRKTLGFITSIQLVEIVARNLSLYELSNRAESYLESMKIYQQSIGYN